MGDITKILFHDIRHFISQWKQRKQQGEQGLSFKAVTLDGSEIS